MADLLQHICVKVQVCIPPKVSPTERGLKCEGILDSHLLPDDHSCGSLLRFLDSEATVSETEGVSLLLKDEGENPFLVLVVLGD